MTSEINSNPDSRSCLDSIVDVSYLGQPYFTSEEVEVLRKTVVGSEEETLEQKIQSTLDERLNRRMKKRVESGDFRVCAAHDLAPIFEKAFDINPKKLANDSGFMALVTSRRLKLKEGDDWKGWMAGNTACPPGGEKAKRRKQKRKGR